MALGVRELCQQRGVSLQRLSEQTGLEMGRIEAIYLGRWTPSPEERQSIAQALGVAVSDIIWGHQTPIQHLYGHGPG